MWIERAGEWKMQYCRSNTDHCGDDCPCFDELDMARHAGHDPKIGVELPRIEYKAVCLRCCVDPPIHKIVEDERGKK